MSTTVTYKGNTITTVNNETRTLLTQDKWVEDDIVITDESHGGGVDTETDPVFSASPAAFITQSDIINWNTKSNFSGNYNDLTNKPTIPAAQVSSDWNATSGIAQILHKPTLSDVATSGNYEDLTNKPNIPTAVSDLNNDRGFITTEIDPVFSVSPAAGITSNDITSWNNKSDFSGSYNDLTDKPTIAGQVNSDWNANSGVAKILNKPTLAYVAMSGNYNDLTNKPILDTSLSTASTRAVENQAISIALEDKASKQYVDTAISNIPSPMVFKGSLGTNGTITSLPSASAINTGFTYKVIQAGIYASQTAEIGDIFISDGSTWILIPSGDDIANVVVTPVQSSGTKIAVVTVNNTSTDLYAPTPVAPPNASTLAPIMDGTAAAGTSTSYARADHIHPVDTSRASANDVSSLTTRVGNLETAIGTGGSVDNKIATAIQGLDSSVTATSGEAISAITITDGKITTSSKITIPTYSVATTAANGLMSAADKAKINALSTVDNNTTYANATTASDGLMSSTDKTKLDTFRPLLYVKDGNNVSVLLGNIAQNVASGDYSIAEGNRTTASGLYSHAEGEATLADDWRAHAEGLQTTAAGEAAHAEGINTLASTRAAHTEGNQTIASGEAAHAEGINTFAEGNYSHAEGNGSYADGIGSHAEGDGSYAEWDYAHAEGSNTTAGSYAHAEGIQTSASASPSHAEGIATTATGQGSHTEGYHTEADGDYSHSEGYYTLASFKSQHVFGECNIADPSTVQWNQRGTYIEIVGNGTTATKSNARTLDWSGNEVLAGKLTVGAAPTNDMDVATKKYVDDNTGGGGALYQNIADGTNNSVLLGAINTNAASGQYSVAEGNNTTASGWASHAEGAYSKASGARSHAECDSTIASGLASHAEGDVSVANELGAHAEGGHTLSSSTYAHAEGNYTTASGKFSHAEGESSVASGQAAHAQGNGTTASSLNSHTEGYHTQTIYNPNNHAQGYATVSSGNGSHAEGNTTTAAGYAAHAEGEGTSASAQAAHTEGYQTEANGYYSHAEGKNTKATNAAAHAEGGSSLASGWGAHAEGSGTTASGVYSHAEGANTLASTMEAHVEGSFSTAAGKASHAEGNQTLTVGNNSHAEGSHTTASGESSHSGGSYTIATRDSQTVIGKYNKITSNNNSTVSTDAAFVIGNGASTAARSDAFAVKWDGTLIFANGTEITPAQFAQLLALLN